MINGESFCMSSATIESNKVVSYRLSVIGVILKGIALKDPGNEVLMINNP